MSNDSNFKKFHVETFEAGFKFKVNMSKFSLVAKEINEFWSDSDSRLSLTGGCHVEAALMLLAAEMAVVMIGDGYHKDGAISEISGREGFPANLSDMVQCYYASVPCFDSSEWDVEELE